jgi:hypothetical protein
MTSRERVQRTLARLPTDRVAVNHRGFSSRAASKILGPEKVVEVGAVDVSVPLTDDPLWLELLLTDPGL